MSRNDDKSRAAVDRIKTAALSAAKGLNRSQAKHAATSAARNVPMGRRKRDQAAGRRGRRLSDRWRKEADERKFEGKILKKEARERCSSFCNMFGNWNDTRSEKSREDPRAQ
uniref:Uncharacterized protein n=1 Tax=Oryza meridionalis TaxID=40149 RepID=A0A0E0EF23_9ORYZ